MLKGYTLICGNDEGVRGQKQVGRPWAKACSVHFEGRQFVAKILGNEHTRKYALKEALAS